MSETLAELAETDALLTALSRGQLARSGDPVLNALSGWVDEIISHPIRPFEMELPDSDFRAGGGRGWRIAATAVVVTAMSSSGIAAAAVGDPLAPFSYVATALRNLAPSERADENSIGGFAAGLEAGTSSRESDRSSADAAYEPFGSFTSEPTYGRHRADDGSAKPRHRATQTSPAASVSVAGYTPTHLALDDGSSPSDPVTAPVETPPVETPPIETPPVETPPVETPPVETPVPDSGPVVGDPVPADSPPTDSGSTGSDAAGDEKGSIAADQAQVREIDHALVEAPADQDLG